MDRDGAVRLRRGLVWFGAAVLILLIKLCIDAKDPSIVAQVRSELSILAVMSLQTVVLVGFSNNARKKSSGQLMQSLQSAIPLAWTFLQELWNHVIYRICILVDRTMRMTTATTTNKERIPSAFLKATVARINGYCRPIVHERKGAQSLFDGAAELTLKIKEALAPRLERRSAAAARIRTPSSALSKMGPIAVPPVLLSAQALEASAQWLARFRDVVLIKIVNAAVSEAWRRRWEILDIIMLLGLSTVVLKSLYLLAEGLRAASKWLQHVGNRAVMQARRAVMKARSAIVLPIWRKRWLIMAIFVLVGSSVLLQGFFDQSWEVGKAALVAREERDSSYHRLHPGGSWRGSWVERTSPARSVMMDFEPAPK